MRQRIWRRAGMSVAGVLPGLAHAQAGAAPPWLAVLPDVLCALAALLLAGFGLWLLYLALVGEKSGDVSIRRHAGGFGGSSTGWHLSMSLARLLTGLTLVLLALALAMARLPVKDDAKADAVPGEARAASSAASTAASSASAAASAK